MLTIYRLFRPSPSRPSGGMRASVVAAAMICACASALAQTTITFRFNDTDEKEMRAALDVFEKANPDIKVTMQRVSWKDARDQLLRESAVGRGPDVVHVAFAWTRELALAGALRPIDDLDASGALPLSDFVANDLMREGAKNYAVPWTADTWAMVYRVDLLAQAGIKNLPTTYDELRADSEQVKARTGKFGFAFPGGSSASGGMWFLANYYWWAQGEALVVRHPDQTFGVGLSPKSIADAMSYYKRLITDGSAPAAVVSYNDAHDPAIVSALVEGKQAIGIMPLNTYRQIVQTYVEANPGKPVPFTSGTVPDGAKPGTTHVGGRALGIGANTQHAAQAWRLVQFLNTPEVFAKPFYTSQLPARKSLLKQVHFAREEEGFARQLADHTRTWGAYTESPAPIGQLWNATNRAFGTALSNQTPVDKAANDLYREIERLLAAKN